MNNQIYKEEALPFIIFNNDKQLYELNKDCMDFIKTVPAPIGVITVAGLYRTGKSYLLNRMLLNKSSGFGVGPTVNACTKGLWIWGTPLKGQSTEGEMMNILIIDSEGIGSLSEDQTHDTRIFSLAILLGSCFIYNSVGSIDENAIQNLSLVVNLTKHIHLKSSNEEVDSEDYSVYFPNFYWVIRDFSLQLLDQENEPISSKEYLEKALAPQKGFSDEVEQKNRIRRLLTSFFKERECITLVRPVVNEENLQKLDQMDLDQLRPEFFEQVMSFRKKVLTRCKTKTLNGKELNGEMFVSLTKSYLQSINNGAVPNIENAWSYLCKNECHKAEALAFEYYERGLKDNLYPRIPTNQEEIKFLHKQLKEQAVELYRKKAVGEVAEEYLVTLLKAIKQRISIILQQNEKESYNVCTSLMQREFASIDKKLKLGEYKFYLEYERDVKLFHQFLIEHGPKVVNRKMIYLDFIQKALGEGSNFFIKNLQTEIDIQRNFSDEVVKKTELELKEVKEEYTKEKREWVQKLNEVEKEKAEYQVIEQRNQDIVQEYQESKIKQEKEYTSQLQKQKQELTVVINQQKEKLLSKEESIQQLDREMFMKQSEFQKEKALLENKALHFQKMVDEYSQKERLFDTSLTNKTSELNILMKDQNLKYEKNFSDLQAQLAAEQEKSQHQIQSMTQIQRTLENQLEELKASNNQLNNELQRQLQDSLSLKNDLQAQYNSQEKSIDQAKIKLKEQLAQLSQEKKEFQEILTSEREISKNLVQESKKNDALLNQKNEFLQSQFNDLQAHLQDIKRQHESTLQALELNSSDQISKTDKKLIGELRDQHQKEINQLKNEIQQIRSDFVSQIDALHKEKDEADLRFRMKEASLQDEVRELQEALQMTERQKDHLEVQIKDAEQCTKISSLGIEQKYIQRIGELEDSLLSLKEKMQSESIEMQSKSEESLAQLKNFYELEKERLENRLIEDKKKSQNSYNQLIEEYEQKIKDEQGSYEDEIEQLKDELREVESQIQNITSQYEHELDLKVKNIENLDQIYKEAKEALNGSQQNHQLQMEQYMQQNNNEKVQLNQKIDSISLELKKKEKDLLTTQQKKEYLEATLQRKEEQWESQKADFIKENNEVQQKLEEKIASLNDQQNQFLESKIQFEKNIALGSQQNEFFGAKVKELEKQLELSNQKYEDRIKNQKQEMNDQLNEKLGKIQQEKQILEIQNEEIRKTLKQEESQHSKLLSQLEREKAVVSEKLSNCEQKLKEVEQKYQQEMSNLNRSNKDINESLEEVHKKFSSEIESLKKQINLLDQDKHDLINLYDRDKVLWEGKIQFLEQQRDHAKQEFQENMKKFEATLQHMKLARQNERAEFELEITEKITQQEKKAGVQIQECNEKHQVKINEYVDKLKKMEKEIKSYNDKQLLDQQSKHNNSIFTEKKFHEMLDNDKKLLSEIEKLKSEREQRGLEFQKEIEKIKESNKQKITEQEDKYREGERKRSTLIFEHEKERAKWNLEKDHLLSQKNDLSDTINKLQKKQEMMTRENERLKNDSKQQKRSHLPQVGTSFQLNVSRNQSSDRKSPISNRNTAMNNYNKERNSYNDYSIINNSIDMTNKNYYSNMQNNRESEEDQINKENIPKSILSEINDQQYNFQPIPTNESNNPTKAGGFKSFQQMMQEKTPERSISEQSTEQTN